MRYLAYGSNLHPTRLRERVASAELLGTARLQGWQLRVHKRGQDGSAKCNVVLGPDAVHVAVFEMAAGDKPTLDRVEGLNRGYRERWLCLPDYQECFFYQASDGYVDDRLLPFTWYKQLVLLGCERHGFPRNYVDDIRAMPDRMDRDQQRHAKNMAMVEKIRRGHAASSLRKAGSDGYLEHP